MKLRIMLALLSAALLVPQPVLASAAIWNPSGTVAAYVDVINKTPNGFSKALYFYEKSSEKRYRGTYCPLASHLKPNSCDLEHNGIGEILDIYEWLNDETVRAGATFETDEFGFKAMAVYDISTNGLTKFIRDENFIDKYGHKCDGYESFIQFPYNPGEDWNLLEVSLACDQYLNNLCGNQNGAVDMTQYIDAHGYDYEPLTRDQYYFDCERLPIDFILLNSHSGDNIEVQVNVGISFLDFSYNESNHKVELIDYWPLTDC
jgi:hypothetical protein